LPRPSDRAAKPNENFLNADLFATAFLLPCEHIRPNVGVLMFEFSRFWPNDYHHGHDFVADLDTHQSPTGGGSDERRTLEIRHNRWMIRAHA